MCRHGTGHTSYDAHAADDFKSIFSLQVKRLLQSDFVVAVVALKLNYCNFSGEGGL